MIAKSLLVSIVFIGCVFSADAKLRDRNCVDNDKWKDSQGFGCDTYDRYENWCANAEEYEKNGSNAKDECCVCQDLSTSSPTPAPSPAPSKGKGGKGGKGSKKREGKGAKKIATDMKMSEDVVTEK